jgi:predicted ATP-dependent endonuclease of OLD family
VIAGLFIRNFKTYQGINFIPLTSNDRFCGIVGPNGAGKSSILEALDCFFNDKVWNLNTVVKRSGTKTVNPYITPFFVIKKSFLSGRPLELAEMLHEIILNLTDETITGINSTLAKGLIKLRDNLLISYDSDEYFFLAIGMQHDGDLSFSILKSVVEEFVFAHASGTEIQEFKLLLDTIKEKLDYIYIPREIDPELFTRLEKDEIQILMGETLVEVINRAVPNKDIKKINSNLNGFIESLADELEVYSYRTPTERQQNIKKNDIYSVIIESFFNTRKLHKLQGEHWLEISLLSSGEKQRAIIDLAHTMLTKHRGNTENVIFAIDEPDSSLHMSSFFHQFLVLYEISRNIGQVLFSSHWYGFLPTVESGSATVISKQDDNHVFDLFMLPSYREQIKGMIRHSKGVLPYDIRLKSINDFVQSVITSTISDTPLNWLICEGSSEKIYFQHLFKDLIESQNLRIVPVGGASEVKRFYQYIKTSYDDLKDQIKGKIYLLTDTDAELVNFHTNNDKKLTCKRIVSNDNDGRVNLVQISANPVSPATEIEHALNAKHFLTTLKTFLPNKNISFIAEYDQSTLRDHDESFMLDITKSQSQAIQSFFDEGNNKFEFANRYVFDISETTPVPTWINDIKIFFESE